MQLSLQQKLGFINNGYILVRKALPPDLYRLSQCEIKTLIAERHARMSDMPGCLDMAIHNEQTTSRSITSLFNGSPAKSLTESLLGTGNVEPVTSGQIILRYPEILNTTPQIPDGHIDGLGSGVNGMAVGSYKRDFTCMVVMLLSDLAAGYSGNFTVWPGSHLILAEHLRTNGHEVLKMGMPELRWPAEPIMLTGQPGDIVLAHHLLVHEGAPNTSNTVRQAVIFRVCHKDCRENALAGFTTIWREWPGLMSKQVPDEHCQGKSQH